MSKNKPAAKIDPKDYRKYVISRLSELTDIFAKAAVGDFTIDLDIPDREDEFTELFAGIQIMVEVIREKTGDLEALNLRLANEVREKAAELKAVVENSPQIIMQIDKDFKLIYINRVVEGFVLKNVIGKPASDFIDKKDWPTVKKVYETAFKTAKPGVMEIQSFGPNGAPAWYKTSVGPIVEGGKVTSLVIISVDITDVKEAEQELRESEERFRAITESATDAIISADSKGRIILFNQGAQQLFGYTAKEAMGSDLSLILPSKYIPALAGGSKTKKAIGHEAVELEAKHKNGKLLAVELTLSGWKAGGADYFTGIMRDITERKKGEETISQRTAELERFNALMIGRELKMKELKIEINELRKRLGMEVYET